MNQDYLDKAAHDLNLEQVLSGSIAALKGVTDDDAAAMSEAFGVTTIRAFAGLHHPKWAVAIVAGGDAVVDPKWVDKAGEGKSCAEIADSPVAVLQGLSDRQAALLERAFQIKTVRQLANCRFFRWAQELRAESEV